MITQNGVLIMSSILSKLAITIHRYEERRQLYIKLFSC